MKALIIPIAIILMFAIVDFQQVNSATQPWVSTVITPSEMDALHWVFENTQKKDTFVTCIFEGEFLMGMTLREATEGGDWAIIPNVTTRMSEINEFFKTNESGRAHYIAKKYNAKYVWVPLGRQTFCGYGWFYPNISKFDQFHFNERFRNSGVIIYEVK